MKQHSTLGRSSSRWVSLAQHFVSHTALASSLCPAAHLHSPLAVLTAAAVFVSQCGFRVIPATTPPYRVFLICLVKATYKQNSGLQICVTWHKKKSIRSMDRISHCQSKETTFHCHSFLGFLSRTVGFSVVEWPLSSVTWPWSPGHMTSSPPLVLRYSVQPRHPSLHGTLCSLPVKH